MEEDETLETYEIQEEGDEDSPDDMGPLTYDDEDPNLVPTFVRSEEGRNVLKKVAAQVIADFEEAYEGSEEYRARRAADWKLFSGDLPPKEAPFQDTANCQVPILVEVFTRVYSQLESELWGDGTSFAEFKPMGPMDEDRAETMELHTNWQFGNDIADWPRQLARGIMMQMWGDVSCYSYFDSQRKRNHHQMLTPDELFVPYTLTSTYPDYSDCPYLVHLMHYSRSDLQAEEGWHDVDDILEDGPGSWDDEPETVLARGVAESQGVEPPDSPKHSPFKILHYTGWDRGLLPGQDRDRYIRAVVDLRSRKVLLLSVHEAIDWKDKARYSDQLSEMLAYQKAQDEHARAKAYDLQLQAMKAGSPMPPPTMGMEMPSLGPDPAKLVAPTRPSWMDGDFSKPQRPKMSPIHMYSHGVGIEPMHGTLGFGWLHAIASYQRAANTALSQFTDMASLANSWTILTAGGVELPDDFAIGAGKHYKVAGASAAGGELEQGIRELKPPGANPQLLEVVKFAQESAEGHMSANPILSGESGKSGETWRGHANRYEAAMKEMTTRGRAAARFFRQVIDNNCKLNALHLPDREIATLLDWKVGTFVEREIGREIYQKSYHVTVHSDLQFSTAAAKVQDAMELLALVNEDPVLQMNHALRHAALVRLLTAKRNYELIPMLGQRPEPPPVFGPPPMPPPGPPGMPPEGPPPPQ